MNPLIQIGSIVLGGVIGIIIIDIFHWITGEDSLLQMIFEDLLRKVK